MIHPSVRVQWMDVKLGKVVLNEISKVFQIYSHRAIMTSDVLEVSFDHKTEIIKITDMFGWTEVKGIRMIGNPNGWVTLGASKHILKLSRDTIIPIYQPNAQYAGFHGETKYPFVGKKLSEVEQGDMVRIRRGTNDLGEEIEFAPILFSGDLYASNIEPGYGYEIVTKSGFYNANNIHLLDRR